MKHVILLTITNLIIFNSFAQQIPSARDSFIGNSVPVGEMNSVRVPTKAYVKENECIMFLKDNESYWKFHETETLKVESIGDNALKVKKYLFLKNNKQRWSLDDTSISIQFADQLSYYKSECPSEKFKLTDEELKILKKD